MLPSQKCGRQQHADGAGIASMRPGCFHPRNEAGGSLGRSLYRASMRPGCFHPRNAAGCNRPPWLSLASMRPGCFHPRNKSVMGGHGDLRTGFNEAGMFPSQKCRDHMILRQQSASFNEAGMFPSQKCAQLSTGGRFRRRASMRPGCFHPRNAVVKKNR